MPNVTIGGTVHELGGLRLSDVRNLSKAGALKKLSRFPELEEWEQLETASEVISASIKRAGGKVTPEEILEAAYFAELAPLVASVTEVMKMSGFIREGAAVPNEESPTPSTSAG
jgi:hypothetical protein